MKRSFLRGSLLFAAALALPLSALAGTSVWNRTTSATLCQDVSTTAVTVLAADVTRVRWSIWTTSGAATVYFREGGTATAPSGSATNTSGPLVAGQSYTEDAGAVVTKAVSVVAKSGTAHVCAKAAVNP